MTLLLTVPPYFGGRQRPYLLLMATCGFAVALVRVQLVLVFRPANLVTSICPYSSLIAPAPSRIGARMADQERRGCCLVSRTLDVCASDLRWFQCVYPKVPEQSRSVCALFNMEDMRHVVDLSWHCCSRLLLLR